jgi:iron-sulfur cluster assembly protein
MTMSVLTLTPKASERLSERLAEHPGEAYVRVAAAPACGCGRIGYSMAIESAPSEADQVLDSGGVRFLVDADSLPFVDGGTIDYNDELVGGGFTIESPNVQGGCGCGGH